MAKENLTMSADIKATARAVDFVTSFTRDWEHWRDILGIMRVIRRAPGTKLTSKYAEVNLNTDTPAEGEAVQYSKAAVKEKEYATIKIERYAKATTIDAINDHGYDVAVQMTDDQFKVELRDNVVNRWYTYLKSGMLKGTENSFQMALAMTLGRVRNRWKQMHKTVTNIVGFCNILDLYGYYGAAQINNVENQEGVNYIKNFMGYGTLFLLSDSEIPRGMVIATPVENIALYYAAPSDEDFRAAGFNYTTDGEQNLIGVAMRPNYDTGEAVTHAMHGMVLFSEYQDGIAVTTFGGSGTGSANLSGLTIGTLDLSPEFDADTITYTAATTNASNKITATPEFADATVEIEVDGTAVENGAQYTWASGDNVVTVKVTNDSVTKTYTVTVTKS